MIPTKNEFGDVLYEREDPQFDKAWRLLIARHFDPAMWMYMYSRPAQHGAPTHHAFKNSVTRKYIYIDEATP
jgi:hypothetical protein